MKREQLQLLRDIADGNAIDDSARDLAHLVKNGYVRGGVITRNGLKLLSKHASQLPETPSNDEEQGKPSTGPS